MSPSSSLSCSVVEGVLVRPKASSVRWSLGVGGLAMTSLVNSAV